MPRQYEAIRNKLAKAGKPYDEAQSEAAAIYNKRHPGAPITGNRERSEQKPRPKPLNKLFKKGRKK